MSLSRSMTSSPRPWLAHNGGPDSPNGSFYIGEQAQTLLIEYQASEHQRDRTTALPGPLPGHIHGYNANLAPPTVPLLLKPVNYSSRANSMQSLSELHRVDSSASAGGGAVGYYGSTNKNVSSSSRSNVITEGVHTIRFQVVIWNIGMLDVVAGTVPMTFRVSLFWNDVSPDDEVDDDDVGTSSSVHSMHVWKMQGRHRAYQQELRDMPSKAIDVPPLAIMNVSTFQTIGSAEVDMLNEATKLMRWTCMYRATVVQENLRVDVFPHDDHDIQLKLAILSHRGKGRTWDRRHWKLALATVDDTQHSTRIPHGLIVDQARLPGFTYNRDRGLEFQFCPLDHGIFDQHRPGESVDYFLKVSLKVLRESGYYDKNIVPILALMNVVAISVLTFDDSEFFYRALITLNIAFVQMGIRMTTDNHLPNVEYEIRLQRILNEFFVVLMLLVLEAMCVYVMTTYYQVSGQWTKTFDWGTGILAFLHNVRVTVGYYSAKQMAKERLKHGWQAKAGKTL